MKISPMSVELIDSMGSDLSVVNAARVSFHKTSDWEHKEDTVPFGHAYLKQEGDWIQRLNEKDQKLIAYLAKHGHWTPFAHAFLSFRIKAPIFVARQLVKHQVGLAWNEVSRRYVDDEPEFWFPEVWRGKPVNAKQGSTQEDKDPTGGITQGVMDTVEQCLGDYLGMIELGVAPEQARMILPQNTMTTWIWSGSLAAFARVVSLRTDKHAQQETQDVAFEIDRLVPDNFKHSWKALLD